MLLVFDDLTEGSKGTGDFSGDHVAGGLEELDIALVTSGREAYAVVVKGVESGLEILGVWLAMELLVAGGDG